MEEKRSIGSAHKMAVDLTILGCIFVLICAWGVLKLFSGLEISFLCMKQYQKLNLFECLSTHTFFGDLCKWGLGFVYFLFGILAIGMFKLRAWSKRGAIFLSLLIIAFYVYFLFGPRDAYQCLRWDPVSGKDVVNDNLEITSIIAFFLFIIYYLTRSKVKRQFVKKNGTKP